METIENKIREYINTCVTRPTVRGVAAAVGTSVTNTQFHMKKTGLPHRANKYKYPYGSDAKEIRRLIFAHLGYKCLGNNIHDAERKAKWNTA